MPHYKSAFKRLRQQEKRRMVNKIRKSRIKTQIKKVTASANKEEGIKNLGLAFSLIDKLAKKKVIHKNNAARKKAKLARFVNQLSE